MVTPRDQIEFVVKYKDHSHTEFVNAFSEKYMSIMTPAQLVCRMRSLLEVRHKHARALAELKKEEQEAVHNIMIPAHIKTKCIPKTDSIPDVGELLIHTNNLLAELIQLQKEQIALLTELKEVKK